MKFMEGCLPITTNEIWVKEGGLRCTTVSFIDKIKLDAQGLIKRHSPLSFNPMLTAEKFTDYETETTTH